MKLILLTKFEYSKLCSFQNINTETRLADIDSFFSDSNALIIRSRNNTILPHLKTMRDENVPYIKNDTEWRLDTEVEHNFIICSDCIIAIVTDSGVTGISSLGNAYALLERLIDVLGLPATMKTPVYAEIIGLKRN